MFGAEILNVRSSSNKPPPVEGIAAPASSTFIPAPSIFIPHQVHLCRTKRINTARRYICTSYTYVYTVILKIIPHDPSRLIPYRTRCLYTAPYLVYVCAEYTYQVRLYRNRCICTAPGYDYFTLFNLVRDIYTALSA